MMPEEKKKRLPVPVPLRVVFAVNTNLNAWWYLRRKKEKKKKETITPSWLFLPEVLFSPGRVINISAFPMFWASLCVFLFPFIYPLQSLMITSVLGLFLPNLL